MLEHSADGALGLVLNDPLDVGAVELLDAPFSSLIPDEPLYRGGPVEATAVIVLVEAQQGTPPSVGARVFDEVRVLDPAFDPETSVGAIHRARAFAGYAGWAPSQLEAEIAEGSWIDVPARADDVFAAPTEDLWKAVVERKGGAFRLVARAPEDPTLN